MKAVCRQNSRRHRAFTLVEVLATLVLVGVVLPVAMRGVTISMQLAARSRHLSEAGELAASKLSEALVLRDPNSFNGTGDFGTQWPEYRWEMRGQLADQSLYEVSVVVSWVEQGEERSVQLTTLVYPSTTTGVTQ